MAVVILVTLVFMFSSEKFSNILQALTFSGKMSVVLFSSKTCHVCQDLLKNTWPQLQQSLPEISFEKIDCVDNPVTCSRYGIYAVPTIVIIKNEVPIVYRGAWRYADIYSHIKTL